MKRKALYSRAVRRRQTGPEDSGTPPELFFEEESPRLGSILWQKIKRFAGRHDRSLPALAAVLLTLTILGGWRLLHPAPAELTQWDIDNAVKFTLSHTPPGPADTTIAAATVAPSVVRVEGYL